MSILPRCIYCGAVEGWTHEPHCKREYVQQSMKEALDLRVENNRLANEIGVLRDLLFDVKCRINGARHADEADTCSTCEVVADIEAGLARINQ